MEDGGVGDQAEAIGAEPLPEDNVLVHGGRLELLLLGQVEYLQGALLGLEGDDLARPVHDGAVGLDRAADDIVAVLEVDDEHLGRGIFGELLPDADVAVGL